MSMNAGYSEEKFKAHIKAVVAQAEGDDLQERPLTLSELKELALSMGMLEDEWDKLQQKAHIHLQLAEDHLTARNFDEAIAEAEKATAINPYLPNGNSVLARAYQMLWLEDDNTAAREKAEYYARKELLTDPSDTTAINVLSTINKKRKINGKDKQTKKTFLIIGGAILLIVIAVLFMSGGGENETSSTKQVSQELIIAEEEVNSKFDLVQTAIHQRNDMIPDLFAAANGSNRTLKNLNKEIDQLKAEIQNMPVGTERFEKESQLDKKIANAKQEVKTNADPENIELLLIQIEGAENRIAFEKKSYNEAVKNFNILVKQHKEEFPEYKTIPYYNAQ